jgi:2-iminobutanoate/2-iminopropanoate deaminase
MRAATTMPGMVKPAGPYTPMVRAGEWLVCSGQIGIDDGVLVEGGLEAELRQAIANLRALLATEAAVLDDVVKTTVFLTDMDHYAEMNAVYVEEFGDHRPARSAIAVKALPLGAIVELEAWALVPRD